MGLEDALEAMAPLSASLMAVPAAPQPGICSTCHSAAEETYPRCYRCGREHPQLSEVIPITMSLNGSLIHQHLRDYKDSIDLKVRAWSTRRLAALTAVFLHHHHGCLGEWDAVLPVPSTQRSAPAEIIALVSKLNSSPQLSATFDADGRIVIEGELDNQRVLVFDDTFTSGKSVWNASRAIMEAGGSVVGPLVVGRHVTPGWPPTDSMLEWLQHRTWTPESCCRCGGQSKVPGSLPL